LTSAELIYEAINALGGRASIQEVIHWIRTNRPEAKVKDSTISTAMSDLSVNGPPSSHYPMDKRFLWRVDRAEYEVYDPKRHGNAGIGVPKRTKPSIGASEAHFKTYDYMEAKNILRQKGLLQQIIQVVHGASEVDHKVIQACFRQSGWEVEKGLLSEVNWPWDAYKDRVVVSIEFSLIDAVHRDFLRALLLKNQGKIDVMVYVTTTFKEPKFKNVKRDIEVFKEILSVPIFIIGLSKRLVTK